MAPPVDKPRDSFTRPDEESAFVPALSASSPLVAEEQDLSEVQTRKLTDQGVRDAEGWGLVNGGKPLAAFAGRWRTVSTLIRNVSSDLQESQAKGDTVPASERWFLENARLLETLSQGISDTMNTLRGPAVKGEGNALVPRAYAVAAGYLQAVDMIFTERTLALYLAGIQQVESLTMSELWALKPMLEFVLLEQFTAHAESVYSHRESGGRGRSSSNARRTGRVETAVRAVRLIQDVDWKDFFEQNDAAERILRQDPSGAYPLMDDESRQMYREVVEGLARQSLRSEEVVVRAAVDLAARAKDQAGVLDARMAIHQTHVGYYLIGPGSRNFKKQLGYKPSAKQRIVDLVLDWPEVYYIVGVELTTIVLVLFLLQDLRIIIPLIPGLLLLIPASHAAIGIVNYLTSFLVSPRRIPKLDYSQGIPPEATTLVVVPCLLLSEAEVHRNVESLEIRYLANRDPNLHFALLTDSPDASQAFDEHDALVGICSALIDQLNQRYAQDKGGRFLHLHRHRVYNPSEGTWMGWERKRGKLMDLNRLLRGGFDSFPVKAGDVSVFPSVRYVITLDSDTKLPPGAAERLIGSLAHPLNRAVIDPTTNTVVEGYTILQPRVSVSVESSRHSRLAAIYSGQTGFDIYTQAISDVYQDLFGEGTFTGKGIYEVDTFQRVLENRFPTNALLSHDLLEGSYARTGLVSDIAVIDDYPSHFSAYSRRLHRWVRGDWQIMWWLLPQVPDHNGHRVPNPLTLLSRWKIFDNLRRSLNDIGLFLLLILGWAILPGGPVYWTLVTLGLLLMPTYCQLLFAFLRIHKGQNWSGFLRERANDFVSGHLQVFVMLVFLPHQALVMLDAIIRTLIRLTVTQRRLLEWETAAEAESRSKKTLVETYLRLTPYLSLAIGLGLALRRPAALRVAAPILVLWILADFFTVWLNRRLVDEQPPLTSEDEGFLRLTGLRTWRYFREFSTPENHWLIPDNVQEDPPLVAPRLSSTNLGLLLNAQLAAHELGYLTLGEYAEAVGRTLDTARQMSRHHGHFFNWYDTVTAEPLEPRFVSTVDSGNLVASLWTLKQSCLGLGSEPLFSRKLWQGIRDHLRILADLSRDPRISDEVRTAIGDLAAFAEPLKDDASAWIGALPRMQEQIQGIESQNGAGNSSEIAPSHAQDMAWWARETAGRLRAVREQLENLVPWALPEYLSLFHLAVPIDRITLESLPSALRDVENQVAESFDVARTAETERGTAPWQRQRLPTCADNVAKLWQALRRTARDADRLVDEMDFRFLFNPKRKLFSTGYNVTAGRLDPSHYDLLASEARMAVFIALAKGEVKQDAWLQLGRAYTACWGERLLLSWSGTMFEYLMPALWMRSYRDTLMTQTLSAAVHCQQEYGRKMATPWGISEAAFSVRDPQGVYQYQAFGVPGLALDPHPAENRVVSPYSSFLALLVDPGGAARNLDVMRKMGCLGSRGFYESCDFTPARATEKGEYEIIRCWMAHHQGMSLLALSNFLNQRSIQKWFHSEPKVKAVELFLHERVALNVPVRDEATLPCSTGKRAAGLPLLDSHLDFSGARRRLHAAPGENGETRVQ